MADVVQNLFGGALQSLADYRNGFKPATQQDLAELAQTLSLPPAEARALVGRLRDDDERPSVQELRDAQVWLERARAKGKPTASTFRRYVDDAAGARETLKEELANHVGIDASEAEGAYRDLISFADRRPTVPLRSVVDAYITILRSLPVDQARESRTSRAFYAARDTIGRNHTDIALRGTQSAFEAAVMKDQDLQLAARIHASVLAYSSVEIAAQTTNRIFGPLRAQYPAVPLADLTDSYLDLQEALRTNRGAEAAVAFIQRAAGEQPAAGIAAWMRAYATVYRAEGDPEGTHLAIEKMAQAPEHVRKNPQQLATAYTVILSAEHDSTVDAVHALEILQRWTPRELELAQVMRSYLALRQVVGHREALARTLYLLERAGTPVKPQTLQRLTDSEVAKARENRTVIDRLGVAVRELPQRVQGWWERPGVTPPAGTQQPQTDTPGKPPKSSEEIVETAPPPKGAEPHPITGALPAPIAPATTPEGMKAYAPGSVYRVGTPECIDLFERAAALAGLPKEWAKSQGLHNILYRESRNGVVGIPNYTYGTGLSLEQWKKIHTDLKNDIIRAKSSATGLGQLLLRNVDVYYPAGRAGIGVPLQEAAGMLAYIKDRYGNPENAWAQYNKRHEGY